MVFYIVGAGIFGSVLAERVSNILKQKVVLIDKRDHIGGNCYTFADKETGINCHRYGAHIFHTSNKRVYDYISGFIQLNQYRHFVMTKSNNNIYSMPIGLRTINEFFNLNLTPSECKKFLEKKINDDYIENPNNLEEQAISLIGHELYNAFIKGYTKKQWQRDPKELPASIIKRLPFRTNYCSDYFNDFYQGIPVGGYTPFFEKLLNNDLINIRLNTEYNDIKKEITDNDFIIYTGAIDEFFNYCYGKLEWRTLKFEWSVENTQDFQGCAVMNEADEYIPYTRTHEFKHFHPECNDLIKLNKTIICREYSAEYKQGDVPYYPVNDKKNNELYIKYQEKALNTPNLILGGRLGTYKYMDMDKTILQALVCFDEICNKYF